MASAGDLRSVVLGRASFRCEYCHIDGWELQVEHAVPRSPRHRAAPSLSPDELNALANLAAACAHCNRFKGDFVTGEAVVFGGEAVRAQPGLSMTALSAVWTLDHHCVHTQQQSATESRGASKASRHPVAPASKRALCGHADGRELRLSALLGDG